MKEIASNLSVERLDHATPYRLFYCLRLWYRNDQKAANTLIWLAFRF